MKTSKFKNIAFAMVSFGLVFNFASCKSPIEESVSTEKQSEKPVVYNVPIPAENSSIEISNGFDYLLYDEDDIKHIFFDMYPEYLTFSNEISITAINTEDVLPYFEGLYLATCTPSEASDWENAHYYMPTVCMYLINLPSSLGYALMNADKRTPYSLILFRKNMNLSPYAFGNMYDLSLKLLDYLWYGDLDDYLDMTDNERQLAKGLDLEPNPDWWSNWKIGTTDYLDEFAVDTDQMGGSDTSPDTSYTIPNYITSNGIKNWTDNFPVNSNYVKTGSVPLSIVKVMAYKQFQGTMPGCGLVDYSSFINLATPQEPYGDIEHLGDYLYTDYSYSQPKTPTTYALAYLESLYGNVDVSNYSLLGTYSSLSVALAAQSTKVVILDLNGEWYIMQGIKTCTYPNNYPSPLGTVTWYYIRDEHSGKPITRRIFTGKILVL